MNLGVGRKQHRMRDGFNSAIQQTQPMVFADNHPNDSLQDKSKGLKQVIIERGLWRNQALDGRAFLLECATSYNCPGHNLFLNGGCCA